MTPEELRSTLPKKKNKEEAMLQKHIFKMHRLLFPEDTVRIEVNGNDVDISMFYSNYNNATSGHAGAVAQAQGRSSGVADITWIRPNTTVLWIELKTPTGTQSKSQKVFQRMVQERGQEYVIWRSFDEAEREFIKERQRRLML